MNQYNILGKRLKMISLENHNPLEAPLSNEQNQDSLDFQILNDCQNQEGPFSKLLQICQEECQFNSLYKRNRLRFYKQFRIESDWEDQQISFFNQLESVTIGTRLDHHHRFARQKQIRKVPKEYDMNLDFEILSSWEDEQETFFRDLEISRWNNYVKPKRVRRTFYESQKNIDFGFTILSDWEDEELLFFAGLEHKPLGSRFQGLQERKKLDKVKEGKNHHEKPQNSNQQRVPQLLHKQRHKKPMKNWDSNPKTQQKCQIQRKLDENLQLNRPSTIITSHKQTKIATSQPVHKQCILGKAKDQQQQLYKYKCFKLAKEAIGKRQHNSFIPRSFQEPTYQSSYRISILPMIQQKPKTNIQNCILPFLEEISNKSLPQNSILPPLVQKTRQSSFKNCIVPIFQHKATKSQHKNCILPSLSSFRQENHLSLIPSMKTKLQSQNSSLPSMIQSSKMQTENYIEPQALIEQKNIKRSLLASNCILPVIRKPTSSKSQDKNSILPQIQEGHILTKRSQSNCILPLIFKHIKDTSIPNNMESNFDLKKNGLIQEEEKQENSPDMSFTSAIMSSDGILSDESQMEQEIPELKPNIRKKPKREPLKIEDLQIMGFDVDELQGDLEYEIVELNGKEPIFVLEDVGEECIQEITIDEQQKKGDEVNNDEEDDEEVRWSKKFNIDNLFRKSILDAMNYYTQWTIRKLELYYDKSKKHQIQQVAIPRRIYTITKYQTQTQATADLSLSELVAQGEWCYANLLLASNFQFHKYEGANKENRKYLPFIEKHLLQQAKNEPELQRFLRGKKEKVLENVHKCVQYKTIQIHPRYEAIFSHFTRRLELVVRRFEVMQRKRNRLIRLEGRNRQVRLDERNLRFINRYKEIISRFQSQKPKAKLATAINELKTLTASMMEQIDGLIQQIK